MSNMTPATAPDLTIPDFEIVAEPESKLEALLADLEQAQAEADAAGKRFKDIKDNIKNEVQALAPGRPRVIIKSKYLTKPWLMRHQDGWRLDSVMLKAVEPKTWVKFAIKTSTWYLEAAKKGSGD